MSPAAFLFKVSLRSATARIALTTVFLLVFAPTQGRAATTLDRARLDRIDGVVREAINSGSPPGAVVLVVHRGEVVYRKAFGHRSKQPTETVMTPDTLFDLASLTKPIATATSIMILLEQGKLRLEDRVADHLPAFGQNGKDKITIEQLLLHTSGLIADNAVKDYEDGKAKALERLYQLKPQIEPGSRFTYSDLNFIVLGELLAQLSGLPLDEFAERNIFAPLGMKETCFRPRQRSVALAARAAPTEPRDGKFTPGEVHDPRSYLLGGVAGHAGLFSTADDLSIYARMILNGGSYGGKRILSPLTVRLMTTARPVPGGLRALGWDVNTSYSSNRGQLFSRDHSFGHTGFTGTSIWCDPEAEMAVIFLSNRVHPSARGTNVNRVRGQVATLAAGAVILPPFAPLRGKITPVLTGIDVLVKEKFARLKGRKIGLVTNHSGLDRDGHSTIDLLAHAEGVTLVALFSPEHGIRGEVDQRVGDSKDAKTGLPIYSLYGQRQKPTPETLKGIDTLVYDMQDAGCRFYTYISTLGRVMEAAAADKLKVVVLDRPNPIGGLAVEGPMLDAGRESFVGYHTLPVRYGLTLGELAGLYNAERKLGADLEVVRMEGWRRGMFYDQTDLRWVNPSPNLRNLTATFLYPGVGLLETTNLSVGRGTDRPFEWFGAPWIDGRRLADVLGEHPLPGVRFVPLWLTPASSKFRGESCGGVQIIVDDWTQLKPLQLGMTLAETLRRLYPEQWQVEQYDRLLGHKATLEGIKKGTPWRELEKGWQPELARFMERRKAYLLYPE